MENSLANRYPELLKEWNYEKNDLLPEMATYASARKVWWKCSMGHEWQSRIFSRTKNKSRCPYCVGKKADIGKDLQGLFPTIAAEWHTEKNGNILVGLSPYSGKKYWWRCANGHEWQTSVIHRTKNGTGCPYCCNQKVDPNKSLLVTHPQLAAEWHAKNKLTPEQVVAGGHQMVWWQCPKGDDHVWKTYVYLRALHNTGCPCCAGRKIVTSNCLATTHPSIAKEWHPTKNNYLTPYQVTGFSNKYAWFQCLENKDHVWRTKIYVRTKGCGCPICSLSKGEKAVEQVLITNDIMYEKQYKFSDCLYKRRLPFDFAILKGNEAIGLIEFQGRQHYEEIGYFSNGGGHKTVVIRDKIKKDYCLKKGLPLLVVPYWQFNEIENIVESFIEGVK